MSDSNVHATLDVLAKKRYLLLHSSANGQQPIKDKTVHYLFISRFFANTMLWAGRVKKRNMRFQDVRDTYLSDGGDKIFHADLLTAPGEQLAYEWEQDFVAMKWAITYLKNGGKAGQDLALEVLIKRVSKHSCPNIMKEGESCPLNNKCRYPKCKIGISD